MVFGNELNCSCEFFAWLQRMLFWLGLFCKLKLQWIQPIVILEMGVSEQQEMTAFFDFVGEQWWATKSNCSEQQRKAIAHSVKQKWAIKFNCFWAKRKKIKLEPLFKIDFFPRKLFMHLQFVQLVLQHAGACMHKHPHGAKNAISSLSQKSPKHKDVTDKSLVDWESMLIPLHCGALSPESKWWQLFSPERNSRENPFLVDHERTHKYLRTIILLTNNNFLWRLWSTVRFWLLLVVWHISFTVSQIVSNFGIITIDA